MFDGRVHSQVLLLDHRGRQGKINFQVLKHKPVTMCQENPCMSTFAGGATIALTEPEHFIGFPGSQRQGGSNLKGSPRLTIFAVVPGAAHSVPHAAFPALSASQTDLYASYAGCPAAGAGAVLVRAALLILCARVGLWEGSGLVSKSSILVSTPSQSPSASSKPP